ncbi:uncharacterized protein K460DRAFT_412861 [Cucurbitaria berberidis CBS 394.84]|uniref:RRM domain-containing protein n=1 Tax=Cucurbitaria berberidis CBS 394.84 TaxID=1168544 RepID=A0A9P4GTY2_9PLEO|nr:uncharacterized protein K460DRAFT_412861 [Cucurbitaria berberidis CBS 394.84]KAF1851277.1 hypothetical protein K460DRAFT_412861 [Cucurbitaria berberidis CBS 394.84]
MSAPRALAQRSIHLRILPRPSNLSESREIFRVLQRFGEVSTFKYLRYEYQNPADNVALAIYRDENSAQRALNASPIRFALERVVEADSEPTQPPDKDEDDPLNLPKTPTKHGINDMLRPSQLLTRTLPSTTHAPPHSPSSKQPPMPFEPVPSPPQSNPQKKNWTKLFSITVDRSRAVHQDFIERQPYWKQFHPMKSMAQEDLAKQVPHIGLSDVTKRPPNAHRTPNRVLRIMSNYVERKMPTLRGMAENSEQDTRFRERRGL